MGFIYQYPSTQKFYGIPNLSSDTAYSLVYGIQDHSSYVLFNNKEKMGYSWAMGPCLYRHIYAFGIFFVLDMSTIVNGQMCYMSYGEPYEYIYYTHTYGFVYVYTDYGTKPPLGYYPNEMKNEETGKYEGDRFYQVKGIENKSSVYSTTQLEFVPRGSWIKDEGVEKCPGVQTGHMCWCGFVNSIGMVGKYLMTDNCKQFGKGYPLEGIKKEYMHVGTATWKHHLPDIVLQYGPNEKGIYGFHGEGVSISGTKIQIVVQYHDENDEYYPVVYISDKDIDDIEPGDTILMKLQETPDASKSWIYLDFDGYKESDYKVKLMVGQAAIWR